MGNIETKINRSASRKRNYIAKRMKENTNFHKKIHEDKIKKDKKPKPWEYLYDEDEEST